METKILLPSLTHILILHLFEFISKERGNTSGSMIELWPIYRDTSFLSLSIHIVQRKRGNCGCGSDRFKCVKKTMSETDS